MRTLELVFCTLLCAGAARADPWAVPPEGSCTEPAAAPEEDAPPLPFRPGDVIGAGEVERLRDHIPPEIWEHRERFFFDGMQLEIGPCYRDYAPPEFFAQATEQFRGRPRLARDGTLLGHVAGLPFPPDTIAPDAPDAALRWAWNWASRYRAGGRFGDLQLTWVERDAVEARFRGEFFWILLAGRADRAGDGYRFPTESSSSWVSGGKTTNLAGGHTCAWRQYATGARRPDAFFWAPEARKVVRGTSPDSEGPFQGCLAGGSYSGLYTHGGSPQLHDWRLVGVRDVLAPINASRPSYPEDRERSFGPYGISFASDRWELRRALILEGRLRQGQFSDGVRRYRWYLDLQTLTPLYYASYKHGDESGGIGYFVGRWSEDRADYPDRPDDPERPVRVIDRVGTALVDWHQLEAIRIESWNAVSTPPADKKVKRLITQSSLRGR